MSLMSAYNACVARCLLHIFQKCPTMNLSSEVDINICLVILNKNTQDRHDMLTQLDCGKWTQIYTSWS